jgi:hypothetical protein
MVVRPTLNGCTTDLEGEPTAGRDPDGAKTREGGWWRVGRGGPKKVSRGGIDDSRFAQGEKVGQIGR